ncbi:prepilin-type cleavage/methylation domain-containing protein [Solidesulfovibrio carbinolicus]|uniref:Prepilin-type cleavage/methylation domain-containing protein n=2 Tax=Solidesulfovibrio carbinolicus TaxID=296842 RepID=A0A4P6HTQ5_9BACT|nr:prepilin-type cleavage/methylation domain-containing protein [Solidesulfovibrio carbinolicus]
MPGIAMPAGVDMSKQRCLRRKCPGFTLIEIVASLVVMGIIAAFGTSLLTNVARGYTHARNADEVVQKAQMALQRMTIEFTQLVPSGAIGNAANVTYNYNGTNCFIFQNGNAIVYRYAGTNYTLVDGVAVGSLQFRYYVNYSSTALSSFSNNSSINLIGVSFNMQGDDTSVGMNQAYSTRVKVNKLQ